MARTYKDSASFNRPSPERVALVNRGGKGYHGGSKRVKARRDRTAARQSLRRGDW